MRHSRFAVIVGTCFVLVGCSSAGSGTASRPVASTVPEVRPAGPAATLAPLTGGKGIQLVAAVAGPDLPKAGYVETEFAASGTAHAYAAKGDLPADGTFALTPSTSAAYKTRIVVRRPSAPAKFDGTVIVEWLNVSGGLDASPDWTYTADEIIRSGAAWVGVSAQQIGIEGGAVAVMTPVSKQGGAGEGIRKIDPARYGTLHHPGDAYSYDIFTQIARALRTPGKVDALDALAPKHLLAVGESQSAFMLTTYADGVQPLTKAFDGFLIHSRGGAAAPLGEPGKGIDIAGTIGGKPTRIRTDLGVPVIMVETETDVAGLLNYLPATQPDTSRIRLWEVAGTAHVDRYQLGSVADQFGCSVPINDGPHHFVVQAALHDLAAWVATGKAPPKAPRFQIAAGKYVLDKSGNVEGGIRTPLVDVPVDMLSGLPAEGGSVACLLAGRTLPLSAQRLAELYPSRAAYLSAFTRSTDAAIVSGFVLPADRGRLVDMAQPDRVTK